MGWMSRDVFDGLGDSVSDPLKIVLQGFAGGALAEASGGDFANGAASFALQFALNQAMSGCDELCSIKGDYADGPGKVAGSFAAVGQAMSAVGDVIEPGILDLVPAHKIAAGAVLLFKGGKTLLRFEKATEAIIKFDNLADARKAAVGFAKLGDDAVPVFVERGPFKGYASGMQSPDGLRGMRLDWDQTKQVHVNWWDYSGGSKRSDWVYGANTIPSMSKAQFEDLMSHFKQ